MPPRRLSGISPRFQGLSRSPWAGCLCSTHPFASRGAFAPRERLACIRHAASVRPEPGSNSPFVSVSLIEVYLAGLSPQDRRLLYVLFLFRLSEIAARRPSAASPYNLPPIAGIVNPFFGFFSKKFFDRASSIKKGDDHNVFTSTLLPNASSSIFGNSVLCLPCQMAIPLYPFA